MTSKSLFFKLMKEDLKRRIWAVALISLGFFFFYPVVAAFTAGEIKEYTVYAEGIARYEKQLMEWLSFNCGMTVFLMMGASLICGLSSFSYLNSKSKVDFFHGIPVRREKLFAANFFNGILILAIPYGICQILAVFVGISNGASGMRLWPVALAAFGLHITYYILMYSTVVVAAMMTGHLIISFLGAMVFASYVPMVVGLILAYFSGFFKTFVSQIFPGTLSHWMFQYGIRFSPVAEYLYQLARTAEDESVSMVGAVLIAWAASVILTGLACFLYRKRPSEAAGKAMAFPVTCPVIRILLTLVCALGLGLFFYLVRDSMGWAIFGIVFGGGICHCVVEIIFNFDFRKLFSHKLQLGICLLASSAVMVVFRYDVFGYDRYLPKAGDVRDAAVHIDNITDWVSYGHSEQFQNGYYGWVDIPEYDYVMTHMKYEDIDNLLSIASEGIVKLEEMKANQRNYQYSYQDSQTSESEEEMIWSQVLICYTLNSGRKVYRSYHMPVGGRIRPALEKMYVDENYQKGIFPVMTLTGEEVAAVRYRGEMDQEVCLNQLSDGEQKALLEAFQKEFQSMTVSKLEKEAPIGLIRFSKALDEEAIRWMKNYENKDMDYRYRSRGERLSTSDFYPVYPSFTETIKILNSYGVKTGGYLDSLDVRGVEVLWEYWNERDNGSSYCTSQNFFVEDSQQINELRKILVSERLCYYNPFFLTEPYHVYFLVQNVPEDVVIEEEGYEWKEDWESRIQVKFPKGMTPEFVETRMKEN